MKRLELRFENKSGKIVTFNIDDPIEPVDPQVVNDAMDVIIEQNAFSSSGGDLVTKHSARVVEQQVEEVEIF